MGPATKCLGLEHGHDHGQADAIVGSERCAVGLDPVAGHKGLDRILAEIVADTRRRLCHHIHVRLQHNAGACLHACRGRLADKHVAGGIDSGLKSQVLAKLHQEVAYLLLVVRRSRDLRHIVEVLPDILRRHALHGILQGDASP